MANENRLLMVFGIFIFLLLAGCITDTAEIKKQEAAINSNMNFAGKLLEFQEKSSLDLTYFNYQNYSGEIGVACEKLSTLDKDKVYTSKDVKAICENKKGIDNCFFQLEKIKTQLKNKDTEINLDSLDALCGDFRSIGLESKLENFKSKYKKYAEWLKGEKNIITEWDFVSRFFWNSTSSKQLAGAKMSDYYKQYETEMVKVQASLKNIDKDCKLKSEFKSTENNIDKICNNIDDYVLDLDKTNAVVYDTFNFFSKMETGTTKIDVLFIKDCDQANKDYVGIYSLKLLKDTELPDSTESDFSYLCSQFENLSILYGSLNIPLIIEDGEISSTTKTELFKAKTVYIETASAIGSGVIVSSDAYGYYILTNAHVALTLDPNTGLKYLPSYLRIKFYGGNIGYATELAYTQEGYDLVVLYVPSSGSYPIATYYEDYYPNAGEKVVAVGNPYGLAFSVTEGTVSAIRDVGCFTDYCYGVVIQTDTAINPGNSGGGLWNYKTQELLGINSLGLTQAQGLNFAISMYQYGKIKDTFKWYPIG